VRQLRLRDVGGIVVIDFIDMVLESNRELVLRRLLECLSRDRTKHQVAEVTSLGLVQMTRKRVGAGLLEAFSMPCECCNGRGVHVSLDLAELGEPGQGCQQGSQAQPGGHARGPRHDSRHADEPSGRPGKRNGDNSDAGKGRNGDSGRSDDAGKGRNGESRPNGGGRRGRNGDRKWHADEDAAAVAHDTADVTSADAPADVAPADAPAGHSQNGLAAPAADVMDMTAPGDGPEATRSPERAPEPGSGPETAAPSAQEAAPWPEAPPMQTP
jgi:ribonuclease E